MDSYTKKSSRFCNAAFCRHCPSLLRDIHLERGHALSGHCEAGGLSQWKHFPSICTAIMPHRYAWQVGGYADDCHEPDEIFASTSLRESARIAPGISLQHPSDTIHNLPRDIQRHWPSISLRESARIVLNFLRDIAHSFPVTFIWNGDMPSQGIVRQVGCPNGSISLPSAQPSCPTDMRGRWVGVQMIVTSQKSRHASLRSGIV